VARRFQDLLPQLLRLAADELRHRARGTTAHLDLHASSAVSAALAALPAASAVPAAAKPPEALAARIEAERPEGVLSAG
jgi:hypothetical protein